MGVGIVGCKNMVCQYNLVKYGIKSLPHFLSALKNCLAFTELKA